MRVVQKQMDSLVEVDAFLGELSRSVHGVLVGLVLDHLHPFAALALLMTVLADHVKLADPVLEEEQTNKQANPGLLHFVLTVGRCCCSPRKRLFDAQTIESTAQFLERIAWQERASWICGAIETKRRGRNKISRIIAVIA